MPLATYRDARARWRFQRAVIFPRKAQKKPRTCKRSPGRFSSVKKFPEYSLLLFLGEFLEARIIPERIEHRIEPLRSHWPQFFTPRSLQPITQAAKYTLKSVGRKMCSLHTLTMRIIGDCNNWGLLSFLRPSRLTRAGSTAGANLKRKK